MTTPSALPRPSRASERARLELARIPVAEPLDAVFRRACELSAEALGVERVGVWLFIDRDTALRCATLFERSKCEHSSGAVLRVADFPVYFGSLDIRKAVPAEVALSDPWTAELTEGYLKPLGITSMLDAGIFLDAKLAGVVCHEHVGPPREWSTEDRDFAGSVADVLAVRIKDAELRERRATFLADDDRVAALDKAVALEQLTAGIAHDFRNLLTVCVGAADLLAQRTDLPPDARRTARMLADAANRGTALAQELIAFARPDAPPPRVLDLIAATAEFLPVLRAAIGSRYELAFAHPPELGRVLIEKSQYARMLLNLVTNARDAMPDGGTIGVRLAPVKLTGNPAFTGRFVLLEVTDTGSGIADAARPHLFEPFFTTKEKGTGLGLAVVRQVAQRAGGLVRVESEPGKGATFRVLLPRVGASTGSTALHEVPPELAQG
jgi:two-component system, cell cycle sensor histidine kinase and response regulator CckA